MLKARIVTALFLVAGFLALLFLVPPAAASAVFAAIAALAGWEWAGLLKAGQRTRVLFGLLVLFSCAVFSHWQSAGFVLLWSLAALFWIIAGPVFLARRPSPGRLGFVIGWLLLVPTWAALSELHARGPGLLLAVMALVWVADIAAYFTGRAIGKHKLAPAISPGKTWEGATGAVVGVMAYGLLVGPQVPGLPQVDAVTMVVVLLVLTAYSIVGDLFESLVKRQAGMKDSSQLLPGHGGILDRIDSQTSTLPLVALLLHWTT